MVILHFCGESSILCSDSLNETISSLLFYCGWSIFNLVVIVSGETEWWKQDKWSGNRTESFGELLFEILVKFVLVKYVYVICS